MGTPATPQPPSHWLAQTKLQPPRLRDDVLPRLPLGGALRAALTTHALTLISAPAGYGKTTLLTSLPHTFPDLRLAWLSLDEEDEDPAHFMAALAASLQSLNLDRGPALQTTPPDPSRPAPGIHRVMSALINDVLECLPETFVLVLDDLHLIREPAVYAALDHLLEHLPPQMHLAVAARHDPPLALARLRARGALAEFRLADLRFTDDDALLFLNQNLRLGLSPEDLTTLQARAEGWPAGLRLLAGSLDRIATPSGRSAFIHQLAATDRYVFDFLAEEVLKRQEPEVRTFLLQTAILSELSPDLCQAVTGRGDSRVVLEDLYRRNLFLMSIGEDRPSNDRDGTPAANGGRRAYRYHALFAEFLRRQLAHEMPERLAELHRRAGEAQARLEPGHAIRHYLAAEAWEDAARLIEQAAEATLHQGRLDTLRGWIEALPAAVRESHPWLIYFLAVCANARGSTDEAQPLLERARQGFESAGDAAGQGAALAELAVVAGLLRDYPSQAALTRQALAHPLSPRHRVSLLLGNAWLAVYAGDWLRVDEAITDAIRVTLESDDPGAYHWMALALHPPLLFLPDGPDRLERYCRRALARFGADGIGSVQQGAYNLLSFIHLLRGQWEDALRASERTREIGRQSGSFVYIDLNRDLTVTLHAMARGDHAAVEAHLFPRLPQYEQVVGLRPWLVPILYCIGRAQWLQGHLEEAHQTYARMCAAEQPQDLPESVTTRALMRAVLELADRQHARAERTLRQAIAIQQRRRHTLLIGNARLLLAHLYLQRGRAEDALSELAQVLADCERLGMPGLILQEGAIVAPLLRLAVERGTHAGLADRLLHLLGPVDEPAKLRIPETGESLTPREAEVLRLIAAGESNRAIAEKLVITERTVKAHVTGLLAKLRVASRTQAVARARELHIL